MENETRVPEAALPLAAEEIKRAVRERYTQVAQRSASCCEAPAPEGEARVAQYGYELDLLGPEVPATVVESFAGCGNPLAIEALRPGEVVLDLGSGAGLDCFLAAHKVGPAGRVIGLDMTDAMLGKARENQRRLGIANVLFCKGEMEAMPMAEASVDVILSNCVINLAPDKDRVFCEAFRVLRPGGRLMVADLVTEGELPAALRTLDAWTCCLGGAIPLEAYVAALRRAGFDPVEVVEATGWRPGVLSVKIRAIKPGAEGKGGKAA
ncbi:MAG: arsenite S-adenosylmethyltransferase [Candidatus Tectimicrobiota bacterium]|nr:MAG: arsenite S-adenosylmethyltransferase [Candidatus Tectomicrobia bacterium]